MVAAFAAARSLARRYSVEALLLAAGLGAACVAGAASSIAPALGLDAPGAANNLPLIGAGVSMVLLCAAASRAAYRLARRARRITSLRGGERGTVMVEFAFVFPLVLIIMCVVLQMAMLSNAALVTRYAAFCAARAAAVAYTRGQPGQVESTREVSPNRPRAAAELVLNALSPMLGGRRDNEPELVLALMLRGTQGPWDTRSFPLRSRYTRVATTVSIAESYPTSVGIVPVIDGADPPKTIDVTVEYLLLITFPGMNLLPFVTVEAPPPATGRAFRITQTVRMQSTGTRHASAALLPEEPPEL